MNDRDVLQDELQDVMGEGRMVCFQPPENVKLSYPCIVYQLDDVLVFHSDDRPYIRFNRYSVTLMTKSPVPEELDLLLDLQGFAFDRHFVSDNIHHFILDVYRSGMHTVD